MKYSETTGGLPKGRRRLAEVLRNAGDVIRSTDVAQTLGVSGAVASKMLIRWADQGWLRRVTRGVYIAVPFDSLISEQVLADPWVLVPALFSPAYIGGRTAAEYWDLTEQIFRDIVVLTARDIRWKSNPQNVRFTLRQIKEERIFGVRTVWRGKTKVAISDVHHTIIDMLDAPQIGGGIQHIEDCFAEYFRRPDADPAKLFEYGDRVGNGAVFKRLGLLAERNPMARDLVEPSRDRLTQGNAKLDPRLQCSRLVSRWKLWVPQSWKEGSGID